MDGNGGRNCIYASVKTYRYLMKTLEFYFAVEYGLYKNCNTVNEEEEASRQEKLTCLNKVLDFVISERVRISEMPGYNWWIGTIKYDRIRAWDVPKEIYDLVPRKYYEIRHHHGKRGHSMEHGISRYSHKLAWITHNGWRLVHPWT